MDKELNKLIKDLKKYSRTKSINNAIKIYNIAEEIKKIAEKLYIEYC